MWFRFWSNVARFDLTSTSQPLSIKPDVDRDSFFRKKRRVEKTIYGYPLLEHIFALFGLTFFGDTQLIRTLSTSIFCIIFGTVTLYLPVLIFWTAQNQFKLTVFPLFFVCVTFLLLLLYNLNKSEILQLNRDIRAFWTSMTSSFALHKRNLNLTK